MIFTSPNIVLIFEIPRFVQIYYCCIPFKYNSYPTTLYKIALPWLAAKHYTAVCLLFPLSQCERE